MSSHGDVVLRTISIAQDGTFSVAGTNKGHLDLDADGETDISYSGNRSGATNAFMAVYRPVLGTATGRTPPIIHELPRFTVAPNPFKNTTTLSFENAVAGSVRILLYDVRGREVKRVLDGPVEAGLHRIDLTADELPSGTYFCRVITVAGENIGTMIIFR